VTDLRSWLSRESVLANFRRWGALMAVGAVSAALAALLVSKALPEQYKATAQLFLSPASNPTIVLQDAVLGQNLARSYVQLVSSEVVLRPAMDEVSWLDLRTFRDQLQVAQIRDTSVITVSFTDTDRLRAAAAANAVANNFIKQSRELLSEVQGSAATQLDDQIRSVQEDIRSLDTQISTLRAELAASPRPSQTAAPRADLQSEILQLDVSRQAKQQTLAQLLKTRDDMRLASARAESTVSLWQPATPPSSADSPKVGLNTALGAVLGIAVALLLAILLSIIDDRVRDADEAREKLGLPALGHVALTDHPETVVGKMFVRDEPMSAEAEAFRSLRTNIAFSSIDHRPQTLLVTSAVPREGKSIMSANLALAFAETAVPTVLIDADLRRPSQHRLFRRNATVGLTSLITDTGQMERLEVFQVKPNFFVIPSGPLPPNPAELLSSARMAWVLSDLKRRLPNVVVIIDTSPVLAVTDAVAVGTKVDGCLVVVDSARTHSRLTRRAVEALRAVRAPVLGVVLNKIPRAERSYYYQHSYETRPTPSLERVTGKH